MTTIAERVTRAMVRELRADAIASTIAWLRDNHPDLVSPWTRRDVAARTMTASVFEQAALLGLLTCSRCGDRGCDWCRRRGIVLPGSL